MLNLQQIKVIQGSVDFPEYENIKMQALKLAEDIQTVQVTEDNVKQSKKLLAAVNKRLKELEDERISIKKLMLEPYQLFEEQVKEIVGIVKDADAVVRFQVKHLEESERKEKYSNLKSIFDKRKKMYLIGDLISIDDFLNPKHLNKSVSIETVENEMIEFLEGTEKDMKVIQKLPNINDHVSAYLSSFDLAHAMTQVQEKKERMKQIEASQAAKKVQDVQAFQFTIFSSKDKTLLEMFMQQNKITYEMDEVE